MIIVEHCFSRVVCSVCPQHATHNHYMYIVINTHKYIHSQSLTNTPFDYIYTPYVYDVLAYIYIYCKCKILDEKRKLQLYCFFLVFFSFKSIFQIFPTPCCHLDIVVTQFIAKLYDIWFNEWKRKNALYCIRYILVVSTESQA